MVDEDVGHGVVDAFAGGEASEGVDVVGGHWFVSFLVVRWVIVPGWVRVLMAVVMMMHAAMVMVVVIVRLSGFRIVLLGGRVRACLRVPSLGGCRRWCRRGGRGVPCWFLSG